MRDLENSQKGMRKNLKGMYLPAVGNIVLRHKFRKHERQVEMAGKSDSVADLRRMGVSITERKFVQLK